MSRYEEYEERRRRMRSPKIKYREVEVEGKIVSGIPKFSVGVQLEEMDKNGRGSPEKA